MHIGRAYSVRPDREHPAHCDEALARCSCEEVDLELNRKKHFLPGLHERECSVAGCAVRERRDGRAWM
jgi:hypothetical protein